MSNNFTKKMKDFKKSMDDLKNEMKETGKAAFQEVVQDLFIKYSWFKSISWAQYTPYFCDGDVCEFSCGARWGDFEINEEDSDDENINMTEYENLNKELKEIFESVDDEIFQMIFGDHIKITIHRNGNIDLQDYDHD